MGVYCPTQSELGRVRILLQTAPATEPVSLSEIKAHCRITHNAENSLLESYLAAARQWCESYTERAFITQTWQQFLYAFPANDGPIAMRRPPFIAASAIAYRDTAGDSQSFLSYVTADNSGEITYLYPSYGYSWPDTRGPGTAVTITYTAGYGAATAVPQQIKQAILLLAGEWYLHREPITSTSTNAIPHAVESLLSPYVTRPYP